MKHVFSVASVMVVLMASQAFAGDTQVPKSTLDSLGLAGFETVSDEEGMEVRGMSASAMTMGLSLVTGLLIDPNTKSFVFGADANAAMATAENAGKQILTQASHNQASSVNLGLDTTTAGGFFVGTLFGTAGGSGMAAGQ